MAVPIFDNVNRIELVCIPERIPGCQTYKEFDGVVGFSACLSGYSGFTGAFYYEDSTSNALACSKAGSVLRCNELTLTDGRYTCT